MVEIANPFQRIGAISNAHVGLDFERLAALHFLNQGIALEPNHKELIGIGERKKLHSFDLGSHKEKIIVECKSHRWTIGSKVPSAKLTVWNEAMYYFHLAPKDYRKIMFVLKHECAVRSITLAKYYLKTFPHLIPEGVEFWEYDEQLNAAFKVH
jgi:hypothetical protein